MDFTNIDWEDIGQATLDTLTMTGCSLFFTILLGLPLGVLLFVTGKKQLLEQRSVYALLSVLVNVLLPLPKWTAHYVKCLAHSRPTCCRLQFWARVANKTPMSCGHG